MPVLTNIEDGLVHARLESFEIDLLAELLDDLEKETAEADDQRLAEAAYRAASRLGPNLRHPLDSMRLHERPVGLVLSGFPIDDDSIGPSPESWRAVPPLRRQELFLLLISAPLGQPFGYRTQQDGRLVHDILPIRGDEDEQLGSSSATELTWHTEDAFHESRCDYLALLCMRNDEATSTTLAIPDLSRLSDESRRILAQPLFQIMPDDSHFAVRNPLASANGDTAAYFDAINQRTAAPPHIAVLSGPVSHPYLRIDPAYMSAVTEDSDAARALAEVSALIEGALTEVSIRPGEVLLLDNYRAVHGRRPFEARYDGRDRWLKRVNVTRDMRRQRSAGAEPTGVLV